MADIRDPQPSPRTVTRLLHAWGRGDAGASDRLLALLYDDLKRRARRQLRSERRAHTLQPTALVHEAYLRLVRQADLDWQNRAQFLALAAVMMRRVLVDHGRARGADKRGAGAVRVTLSPDAAAAPPPEADFGDLDRALAELAQQDPHQARLVELRVFGGLTFEDVAEVLGVPATTCQRDWSMARAWLFRRLKEHDRERRGMARL
ncbi:MAG: sigma-70 family RNA polymerase sigma factor [Vicinamibacteria bacterium]